MSITLFALLSLIWGSTWMAIKIGLEDSPPFWSAGIRFVAASLIIVIINSIRRRVYPRDKGEIIKIAFPGVFMYAASYMLVYSAETHIDSSLTAVIFSGFPIFVALISYFMLREERLSPLGWLGMAIGLIGIVMVSYSSLQESQFRFWGVLMAVLAAVASAYGTVYIRAYLKNHDIFVMAAIQMTVGAILIILTAMIFEPLSAFKITAKSVGALAYLALFGTVVAFLGYYWLLQKMRAISVSLISFIIPVIAILVGHFFLSETITALVIFGTILILAGVALVLRG
ncbi:putative DMT superfamily drug/metaboltie permease [Candidatus Zixiibacteriota bacterium]|nr:putative DMT superfamily drug/metaboltie permease [candidate division Zixibacteria bacterium]